MIYPTSAVAGCGEPHRFTAHCIKSHFLLFVLDVTLSSLKVCAELLPVDSFDPYLL